MTTSQAVETPSEWCQRMMDNAKDGTEAMTYFTLKERWVGIIKQASDARKRK